MSKSIALTVLVLSTLTVGCTTVHFQPGPGGPVGFDPDLPPPTESRYVENGLHLKIYSPDVGLTEDAKFMQDFIAAMREKKGSIREAKSPAEAVYMVDMYESNYSSGGDLSKAGGLIGAITGGAAGYGLTETGVGAGVGGGVGAALGAWALKDNVHVWSFAVTISQRTSAEGRKYLEGNDGIDFTERQSTAGDLGKLTNASALTSAVSKTEFNIKSNTRTVKKTFLVLVKSKGPLAASKEAAAARARKELAGKLPGFIFGGTTVSGWSMEDREKEDVVLFALN